MEELLNNPYIRIAAAIVASSLALSIINLFPKIRDGERWYHNNKFLILIIATIFTLLLTDLETFLSDWQLASFKVLFIIMISFLVAVTKGQEIVDSLVNKIANKIKDKADSGIDKSM